MKAERTMSKFSKYWRAILGLTVFAGSIAVIAVVANRAEVVEVDLNSGRLRNGIQYAGFVLNWEVEDTWLSRHVPSIASANGSSQWVLATYSPSFRRVRVDPSFGGAVAAMRQIEKMTESGVFTGIDDEAIGLAAEHVLVLWKDDGAWNSERFMNRVMALFFDHEHVTRELVSEVIESGDT